MKSYKEKAKNYQKQGREAILPNCFLSPCYLFADLLWKKVRFNKQVNII